MIAKLKPLLDKARQFWARRRKAVLAFLGAQAVLWIATGHYQIDEEFIGGLLLAFGVERLPNKREPVGGIPVERN